jgi:hypothetical protein
LILFAPANGRSSILAFFFVFVFLLIVGCCFVFVAVVSLFSDSPRDEWRIGNGQVEERERKEGRGEEGTTTGEHIFEDEKERKEAQEGWVVLTQTHRDRLFYASSYNDIAIVVLFVPLYGCSFLSCLHPLQLSTSTMITHRK